MELDVQIREAIPLNDYPDFSELGYQVIKKLGCNQQEGRITYLANVCNSHQQVVIKEFRIAKTSVDWSGGKTYEREIQILQQIDHPRIPRYIDSFEMPGNFYLVQEYKNAPSLGRQRNFKPEEIKQIAISILEILVYLQQRVHPIIHRDIKPENILVDEQLNAYLVDFGSACIQDVKGAFSSFACGTPGFISPEEQRGYGLNQASDLYGLGGTIICLLTNTRSVDIGKLIDDKYRFHVQKLLPQLNPRFKSWLHKMVEPKFQYRYGNAAIALKALKPLQVTGNESFIDTFVTMIKSRQRSIVMGVAIIAMFVVATSTLILSEQGGVAQQLQEMRE
jgi:serine/threonine protein kinase